MKIRLLVMDVDGTLTDGRIYMGEKGEVMKAFDVKDGYAIASFLPMMQIVPVIITGRTSKILERRAEELGIVELHQGVGDKLLKLQEIAKEYDVSEDEIAYIGDDINDISCMTYVGFSGCPKDAVEEVKEIADYICCFDGGRGAVRDFIEEIERQSKAPYTSFSMM